MTKVDFHFYALGINIHKLSKQDKFIFLSYLFIRIYKELFKTFMFNQEKYFQVIKQNSTMEEMMLEADFLVYIINDILSTEEYTLSGIALYAQIPEDAIQDLFMGLNKNPSSVLWRKIIDLHSTIRHDFYRELIKKIILNNNDNK